MYRWDDALATPAYVELSVDLSAYATKAELAAEESAREAEDTDLKNALDATNKRVENLEEKAGDYTEVDVKSVYSVPTGKASNMVLVGLRGVSRGKNQLIARTTGASYSGTTNDWVNFGGINGIFNTSHTILIGVFVNSLETNTSVRLRYPIVQVLSVGWNYVLVTSPNSANLNYQVYSSIGQANCSITEEFATDLNTYFNTSDLSFLGATDSAKLATIQTNYPWLLTPSSYGTSMVKTRYEGVRSKGKNRIASLVNGYYSNANFDMGSTSNTYRSFKVWLTAGTYTISSSVSLAIERGIVDGVLSANVASAVTSYTFTANTTGYVGFSVRKYGSFDAWDDNNTLQLEAGSSATAYSPYFTDTLSLPTPITLRSAGSVAEKAYLNEDGSAWKTNPIGSVDLSTLNWSGTYSTDDLASLIKKPSGNGVKANMVFSNPAYTVKSVNSDSGVAGSGDAFVNTSGRLVIRASSTPSGYMYYELATPDADTPLTVLTDNWIATEGGGTLEAVKTYPIDDSFTVGYLTL